MLGGLAIKNKKIEIIKAKIKEQPIYAELFSILQINIEQDFMQAELVLDQVIIGKNFVKISEPTVKLLDFFKSKEFALHSFLPAYESENYKNPVIAWMIKN